VLDELNAEEISVGDYVLTGGELPALILTDAIARVQGSPFTRWSYSISGRFLRVTSRAVSSCHFATASCAPVSRTAGTALSCHISGKRPDMLYDHRVNGEPYARYIRVFVPHKERPIRYSHLYEDDISQAHSHKP